MEGFNKLTHKPTSPQLFSFHLYSHWCVVLLSCLDKLACFSTSLRCRQPNELPLKDRIGVREAGDVDKSVSTTMHPSPATCRFGTDAADSGNIQHVLIWNSGCFQSQHWTQRSSFLLHCLSSWSVSLPETSDLLSHVEFICFICVPCQTLLDKGTQHCTPLYCKE